MSRNANISKGVIFAASLFFSLFLLTGNASAAESEKLTERSLAIEGIGRIMVAPDTAFLNLSVSLSSKGTVNEAQEENSEAIRNIVDNLSAYGVTLKDVHTNWFNIYPTYPSMPEMIPEGEPQSIEPQKTDGFQIDHQIEVELHDLESIEEAITKVSTLENVTVQGVNYSLQNAEKYIPELRAKAIANAKEKASALADALDIIIGKLIFASEYSNLSGYCGGGCGGGGYYGPSTGGIGTTPRKTELAVTVNLTFELINKTK